MSVDITQIDDHGARMVSRLAEQYKGKPLIEALLATIAPQVQQVEDMLFGVLLGYRLEASASGEQLDVLGRVVGQDREAADDAEYRLRIAARIRANVSTGSAESIYRVFSILLPAPDNTLAITPHYPASFVLDVFGAIDPTLVSLYSRFLADSKAAGVGGAGIYTSATDATTFTFSAVGDPDDADLGFGDTARTTGGHLGGIF